MLTFGVVSVAELPGRFICTCAPPRFLVLAVDRDLRRLLWIDVCPPRHQTLAPAENHDDKSGDQGNLWRIQEVAQLQGARGGVLVVRRVCCCLVRFGLLCVSWHDRPGGRLD